MCLHCGQFFKNTGLTNHAHENRYSTARPCRAIQLIVHVWQSRQPPAMKPTPLFHKDPTWSQNGHRSANGVINMPRRSMSICTTPGCPEYTHGGRCTDCQAKAEQRRGTSSQRGYGTRHRTTFRAAVLARDPTCVCTESSHGHGTPCGQSSQHADHHPRSRRELAAAGADPDDPRHGRGLCAPCHSSETALHQPGGWAAGDP